MGLTDVAGGLVDKAAGALGVDDSKSGPKPEAGEPAFELGEALDPTKEKKAIVAGPNAGDTPPNTAQPPDPIEFVHFGYVHEDTTDHYVHPQFDNDKKKDDKDKDKDKDKEKGAKPAGRAILFRDAVEREMVLLHGFISAAKRVHEELKTSTGLAGAAAAAVGSLIGDSGKGPAPGSLKYLQDDITKAGETINADSCDYVKIHKAGIDLHQTRADFNKYCKEKLEAYYLDKPVEKKPGVPGPEALLMSLPKVAGGAKTVFNILFKAFDIYFGMFLALRSTHERAIEDVCHTMSFKVVKGFGAPTYAIWFAKPKEKKEEAAKSTMPSVLGDAENKINETKKDVDDKVGYEEKKPAPGEDAVNAIFALLGSGPSEKKADAEKKEKDAKGAKPVTGKDPEKTEPIISAADTVCIGAFNSVLGFKLPGFLATAIGKVIWGNVEYLRVVYIKLCNDPTKKLDVAWLEECAMECLSNKLYGFLEDSVSFIKSAEDFNVGLMGQKVGPQKYIDKGKEELNRKLAGYCDPVLKLAVGRMADVFEEFRSKADGNKELTMETFLGHLPFFLAFQVRNCTFPMWKTLIDEELGKGTAALSSALKPVTDFLGDTKDFMTDAKDYKDRAGKIMEKQDKEGITTSNFMDYKKLATDSTKKKDDESKGGSFPGGKRTATGTGPKISSDDVEKAKKDRKNDWPLVDDAAKKKAEESAKADADAEGKE